MNLPPTLARRSSSESASASLQDATNFRGKESTKSEVSEPTTNTRRENILKRRLHTFVSALLGAVLLLFVAAPRPAHADDRSKCQHAVEKAEANLDHAIRDHGERSPQADARRRDLYAERQHCWDQYHQWWNGKDHRWETERWEEEHDH
jgi:hypothetical protein